MSVSASKLIQEIAVFATDHLSAWSKQEIIENLNSAIACAIQRGNAITTLSGYQASAAA